MAELPCPVRLQVVSSDRFPDEPTALDDLDVFLNHFSPKDRGGKTIPGDSWGWVAFLGCPGKCRQENSGGIPKYEGPCLIAQLQDAKRRVTSLDQVYCIKPRSAR